MIILSHVLEHFTDPVDLLRKAAGALSEGGVIVIEVPNDVDGILRYNGEDEPHLTFFELDTLATLFERAAVSVLDSYGAGPPNVRDALAHRARRFVRNSIAALPLGNRLVQARTSSSVRSDDRFDQRDADGLFLRAVVKA